MPRPNIDDWMSLLDETCRDVLADTIRYRPRNGAYGDVRAYVDYGEEAERFETAALMVQSITVSLMKTDVPAKPGSSCRVMLAREPGKTFAPVNVRPDEAGTHWAFELEQTSG